MTARKMGGLEAIFRVIQVTLSGLKEVAFSVKEDVGCETCGPRWPEYDEEMSPSCPVFLFRSDRFSPSGNTVISVAPANCVVTVYGGGGVFGEGGLSSAFGGAVVLKNNASGDHLFGVWGARNASRFRSDLRAIMSIDVIKQAPDARLVLWDTKNERPTRTPRL